MARRGSWPTPTQHPEARNLGANRIEGPNSLAECARNGSPRWPTPRAEDSESTGAHGGRIDTLTAALRTWPTPTVGDANSSGSRNVHGSLAHAGVSLTDAVRGDGGRRRWPTPAASDEKGSSAPGQRRGQLSETVAGQRLSPDWEEWLMGWPVGWSSLEPLDVATPLGWAVDPGDTGEVPRTTGGCANRRARLRAIGNGQVPACAAAAFRLLYREVRP